MAHKVHKTILISYVAHVIGSVCGGRGAVNKCTSRIGFANIVTDTSSRCPVVINIHESPLREGQAPSPIVMVFVEIVLDQVILRIVHCIGFQSSNPYLRSNVTSMVVI